MCGVKKICSVLGNPRGQGFKKKILGSYYSCTVSRSSLTHQTQLSNGLIISCWSAKPWNCAGQCVLRICSRRHIKGSSFCSFSRTALCCFSIHIRDQLNVSFAGCTTKTAFTAGASCVCISHVMSFCNFRGKKGQSLSKICLFLTTTWLVWNSWESLLSIKYLEFFKHFPFFCGLCNYGLIQLHAYPSMLLAMSHPLFRKVLCIFSSAPDFSHLLPIVSSPHPSVKLLFKCFCSASSTQVFT